MNQYCYGVKDGQGSGKGSSTWTNKVRGRIRVFRETRLKALKQHQQPKSLTDDYGNAVLTTSSLVELPLEA